MPDSPSRNQLICIVVISIVALVAIIFWVEFVRLPIAPGGQTELTPIQLTIKLKGTDILAELIKLFLTWSIGMLGVAIYVAKNVYEKGMKLKFIEFALLAGATNTLLLAIYFGHLALNRIAVLLLTGLVTPVDRELEFLIRNQYWWVLISTALLLLLAFRVLLLPRTSIPSRFALRKGTTRHE